MIRLQVLKNKRPIYSLFINQGLNKSLHILTTTTLDFEIHAMQRKAAKGFWLLVF